MKIISAKTPFKMLLFSTDKNHDLKDWRIWFSKIISLVFFILFPISFIFLFPVYLSKGQYYLIILDILFWIYLLLRAIVPAVNTFLNNIVWPLVIYILTISFFINLGPNYARSGWIIVCSVITAIYFGVRGAIFTSILNAAILLALYWLLDPSYPGWRQVYTDGVANWCSFTLNLSLLSFCASISVSFLINRLNKSLQKVHQTSEKLQITNQELRATVEELEAINEEFEAQNNELIRYSSELEESNTYNRILFSKSGIPILILNPFTMLFTDCNLTAARLYGFQKKDDMIGRSPLDFSPEIQPNGKLSVDLVEGYKREVEKNGSCFFEWRNIRDNGEEWDTEIRLTEFKLQEKTWVQLTLTDITARKRAEEEKKIAQAQLLHAQKMEAIGTLAGGIAHDFNNVLGGIIGSIEILKMMLKDENLKNKDEIDTYIKTAKNSSKNAAEMVKHLLTLSKKRPSEVVPVDIKRSIDNVIKVCLNSFPKSVTFTTRLCTESVIISADRSQIEQVLLNLCVNASHAMTIMREKDQPQGGDLIIELKQIESDTAFCSLHPEALPGTTYACISVTDQGIGMTEEEQKRIFEPFYSTKHQDEGTGLGLAITYSIIRNHNGFIDVSSSKETGSTFTIYLPLASQLSDNLFQEEYTLKKGTGSILVVDDEKVILNVSGKILSKCGYSVTAANTPREGLEIFRKNHKSIDAVIIDNSMPDMPGPELFLKLYEVDPQVRVMLSSGFMDDALIQKCYKLGIKEFIDKPFTAEELSKKVKKLMEI